MTHSLHDLLLRVAEETFERLAFMFAVPEEEAPESALGSTAAAVAFEGAFQGRLAVSITDEMLPALAMNMLGLEEEVSPTLTQQHDALKELANVVCGNLLPEIAGPKLEFRVAAPELNENDFPGEPASGQKQATEVRLILDSGQVKLVLFLDNDALAADVLPLAERSQQTW